MTFKKLALTVALMASFAAHAEGEFGVLPAGEAYTAADSIPLLQAQLINTSEVNEAYVVQEGLGSIAYITQETAEANFAAVVQNDTAALAAIYQLGDTSNRALIVQRGTVEVGTAAAFDVDSAKDAGAALTLAKNAIKPVVAPAVAAPVMNEEANVALIHQTGDGAINNAYIDQVGTADANANLAVIIQSASAVNNLAMIAQIGSLNKALITQTN